MGAFQSGFGLGQRAYESGQVLALRAAANARAQEAHTQAMAEGKYRLEDLEDQAATRRKLAGIQYEAEALDSGLNLPAYNKAADDGFDAALEATGRGLPMPAMRGNSNMENEAALRADNTTAVDKSSIGYRRGLNRLAGRAAIAKRDFKTADELAGQDRLLAFDEAMNGGRAEWSKLSPEQQLAFAKQHSDDSNLPIKFSATSAVGKDGKPTYMAWVPGTDNPVLLSQAELGEIYAATKASGQYGDLARKTLLEGSQALRTLSKDFFDAQSKVMTTNNTALHQQNSDLSQRISAGAAASNAASIRDMRKAQLDELKTNRDNHAEALKVEAEFAGLTPEEQAGPKGLALQRRFNMLNSRPGQMAPLGGQPRAAKPEIEFKDFMTAFGESDSSIMNPKTKQPYKVRELPFEQARSEWLRTASTGSGIPAAAIDGTRAALRGGAAGPGVGLTPPPRALDQDGIPVPRAGAELRSPYGAEWLRTQRYKGTPVTTPFNPD